MENIGIILQTHDFIRPSALIYLRDSTTLVDDKNAEEIGDCSDEIIKIFRQKYVILMSVLDNFIKDTRYKFSTMYSSPEISRKKVGIVLPVTLFCSILDIGAIYILFNCIKI